MAPSVNTPIITNKLKAIWGPVLTGKWPGWEKRHWHENIRSLRCIFDRRRYETPALISLIACPLLFSQHNALQKAQLDPLCVGLRSTWLAGRRIVSRQTSDMRAFKEEPFKGRAWNFIGVSCWLISGLLLDSNSWTKRGLSLRILRFNEGMNF